MTAFPTVNILDAATFAEVFEDPAISPSKMEGGYVLSRPRFTRRPRRSFSFIYTAMTDSDRTTLLTFWNTVYGSSNSFTWVHPVDHTTLTVRFDPATKLKFSRIGFGPINIWQTDTIILTEV